MKTARLTLLTTPDFKASLERQAAREGVSVAELVRSRCEQRPSDEDGALVALTAELRKAVREARAALREGLAEASETLSALRAARSPTTSESSRRAQRRPPRAHS
jgi:hypothetical protein